MKKNEIKLFRFREFDEVRFIETYRRQCEERVVVDIPPEAVICGGLSAFGWPTKDNIDRDSLIKRITVPARPALRDENRIIEKASYLMHDIIYACLRNGENHSPISTKLLRHVIGDDYIPMLEAFVKLGFIETRWRYYSTTYCQIYHIREGVEITRVPTLNQRVISYIDRTREFMTQRQKKMIAEKKTIYGEKFMDDYLASLRQFIIADVPGFEVYAENAIKVSEEQIEDDPQKEEMFDHKTKKVYFDFIRRSLQEKKKQIYKIDDSGRFYHVLTSLKRELKTYINIKHSIDVSNSHPVLFNYILFYYKDISKINSYLITYFLKHNVNNSIYIHNSEGYLRNELIRNDIAVSDIAKLSDDELDYIYKTTTGQLWDEFQKKHPELERHEVKIKLFEEVFYSKKPMGRWKKLGWEFHQKYPSVSRLIDKWKEPKRDDVIMRYLGEKNMTSQVLGVTHIYGDSKTVLSRAMMSLEAEIFQKILTRIYAKRIKAVHIHDAIVLPDTKGNQKVKVEEIEQIFEDVYREYGLCPTVDID